MIAPLAGRVTARAGPKLPVAAGLMVSALGVGLLAHADAGSSYLQLLPSLLLWGIGIGILTPAVVAAAVRTVPSERARLASPVNNTARQAGGAIGIAAFGAIAGSAANVRGAEGGMHVSALLAVGVWADCVRSDARPDPRPPLSRGGARVLTPRPPL